MSKPRAEFVGSFLFKGTLTLALLACGAYECGTKDDCQPAAPAYVVPTLIFLLISYLASPLGADLNAALSMGVWASGNSTLVEMCTKVAAQCAGVATAMIMVQALAPVHLLRFAGPPKVPAGIDLTYAWGREAAITSVFIGIILNAR